MKFTFPLALTFLTIIPWPRQGLAGSKDLARSMFWFPWVGGLLGLIYWGAWEGLGRIFPPPAAAALVLTLTVVITRGLHLDGLADTVDGAIDDVQRGTALARSLESCRVLFPASVIEMVSVAEESGRLDKELTRLAAAYEQELDRHLKMLVALVEPALLFIMAALVGTIVIGMILPIFNMQELIR